VTLRQQLVGRKANRLLDAAAAVSSSAWRIASEAVPAYMSTWRSQLEPVATSIQGRPGVLDGLHRTLSRRQSTNACTIVDR
jgi:hypothetical protein